jgi:hypothetical protein
MAFITVKIIKASKRAWYSDRIGYLAEVDDDYPGGEYYMLYPTDYYLILKSDCEIIIDKHTKWCR